MGRDNARRQRTTILVAAVLLLLCFLIVAFSRASFSTVNFRVNAWAASINAGAFTRVAFVISDGFDTVNLLVISLVTAVVLLVRKHGRYSLLLLGAMGGDALLVSASKALIISPRPMNEILTETGYSFPSGHTTSTVVFFGILTYFIWQQWCSSRAKASSCAFYAGIVGLVGFDRIYLNVHWLSDILGSVFLGSSWVLFCIFIFKFLANRALCQQDSNGDYGATLFSDRLEAR
jgi:undecaprenyl-diphosphatase